MWLFSFGFINIIGCITLVFGSVKFGSYLGSYYFNDSEAIGIISFIVGCFLAYRLSKYTHIWGESHMVDDQKIDPLSKILDRLGLSFLVPILFIYIVIWVVS